MWSPDGRLIVYTRFEPASPSRRLRVMSSLGGSDRKVSDFAIRSPAVWTPDGRYLVAGRGGPPDPHPRPTAIYLIPVAGGDARAITHPAPPAVDKSPAFSPDGHRLAFASCGEDAWSCSVQVVSVNEECTAIDTPRQLTSSFLGSRNKLAWTVDGKSIVFDAEENQHTYLWRVDVDDGRPPERIEVAGVDASHPSISPAGDWLVFTRTFHDEDIYRVDAAGTAAPVARSSVVDGNPQISADGRRIVFNSMRSGDAMEVWVVNADGSSPSQLTHGPGRYEGEPSWSRDGRRVAYQSAGADGHSHIWTVDSDGGSPLQFTYDTGDQMSPAWSRDGRWIYYSWSRAGERDIWRTRGAQGPKERVTHGGGFMDRNRRTARRCCIYRNRPSHPSSRSHLQAAGRGRPLHASRVPRSP